MQAFKGSHGFLLARKATWIEALFEVPGRPLDEFNACRNVAANDSPRTVPPPTPERLEECLDFLKGAATSVTVAPSLITASTA